MEVWQPIYPGLRNLLDPEYVSFHDQYTQYIVPDELKTWSCSVRESLPIRDTAPTTVGRVQDIQLPNSHLWVRAFVPIATAQDVVYPALLWFHGGGWIVGNLDSENDFCSYICQTAKCIVFNVGYRLAPEHPYPAAAEDAVEALQWLIKHATKPTSFNVDVARIAIGGHGAGGNLAAVLVMEAACLFRKFKPVLQLLIVPIIDNRATPGNGWINIHAPWLTPARMLWLRQMYLPKKEGPVTGMREDWQISPNLAPKKLLAKNPQTWIAVAEHDLLSTEALAYAHQLRAADVQADVKIYEGSTHSILALSGVLFKGRQLMQDAVYVLSRALRPQQNVPWPSPESSNASHNSPN